MLRVTPELNEVKDIVSVGVRNKWLVVLVGVFGVNYKGRAISELSCGERLLIIKPDGCVLIHNSEGVNPINWMREGSSINAKLDEEVLNIKVLNINPREELVLRIQKVSVVFTNGFSSVGELRVIGSEADMARKIYENPSVISKNFKPVSLEEQTKYGFIDVLGCEGEDYVVVECKRYRAGLSGVQQLRRYVEKFKKARGINNVKGVLAAPSITKNAFKMLTDWGFSYKRVEPPMHLIGEKTVQEKLSKFLHENETKN